jgi:biofilm protein TabA
MAVAEDFPEERDLAFYTPPASHSSLILGPGHYAVYFPGEPHRPCCAVTQGGEDIRKVVFKIFWTALV